MLMMLLVLMTAVMMVFTAGCSKQDSPVVAKVGDRSITLNQIDGFFIRQGFRFVSAEMELEAKKALVDSLVNQNLLIIGAFEHNLDNQDEVLKVVEGEKVKFLLEVLFDEKILSKAVPSEAELKDWYVRMGEELKASHIITDTEEKAQDILQKLKEGAVFEELAVEFSIDPSAKRNQGDLGWFTWGTMVDNFQKAAFQMQPGEISAPVKTEHGYHIIKVTDRRDIEHRPSYAEYKDVIRTMITERRKQTLMREYAEELKKQYPITVKKETCQFVLNKLEFLYPDTISGRPRWRNNVDPAQLDIAEKALALGQYEGGQLTLGQYLSNLRRVPPDKRPDFDKYDSLSEVIFQMSFMDILQIEAISLGMENNDRYKEKMTRFKELAMADVMRNDSIPYNVELDEGEVQEYYDTHIEEFTTPLKFHLFEIQVADESEAKTYARTIKSETEFKRISGNATLRPGKKTTGGDLGLVQREQYPELFDLAANLKQGRIAGPIELARKYSVIWVKQKVEPVQQDFNLVKSKIIDQLTRQKGDAMYSQWIDEMKKRISIEVYDDVIANSIDEEKYVQPDTTEAEVG